MIRAQVLMSRPGDKAFVQEHLDKLAGYSRQQLVDYYNRVNQSGFFGSHAQGLHVAALHITMKRVFGKSPITVREGGLVIELDGGEIILVGDQWEFCFS